ncbi:hypothetical protein QEH56_01105 [Pelagicoccus enzymogenes]|uniref:hypothetical protein n=1 Tax=Pelagicoccus enzymogenes TaxID=2773457 RepID=UPI00280D1BB1|nr:hypothetical protein [Pelagicoccus enzymogenes]MDQ8196721.1 hypothetical protein [Pelagicoccus enzymogenes]
MTSLTACSTTPTRRLLPSVGAALALLPCLLADDFEQRLAALAEQNEALLKLAQQQQAQIAELKARLDSQALEVAEQEEAIAELRETSLPASGFAPSRGSDRILISGDAGFAFFAGEANNEFPNEEFRVDDARLTVEAQVHRNAYLVSTLELFRRESGNESIEVGSLYLDVENIFGPDYGHLFNFRIGRFDIPFGEEYLNRYVMENPLVSHSVADLWGIDQGIELYGDEGNFSYAVAIQNGGTSLLRDFDSDKSIAGRVAYQFNENFKLSGSLMRTGDIDVAGDAQSELWIGNVVFLSLGSTQTTKFWADLAELDFTYEWDSGLLTGHYGQAWYDNNDPQGDSSRDFEFYSIEARQTLGERFYAAARYSAMEVDGGYPFSGNGARSIYLFGGILTEKLERLSLGFGYWAFDDVVFKLEYSIEEGDQTNGRDRKDTDQIAAEVGVRF